MAGKLNPNASSLTALAKQYQTITNNLANASTAGFKRQTGTFASILDSHLADAATVEQQTDLDLSQGTLSETGSTLDLAIDGKGFFVIETPEGPMYTRCGSIKINSNGRLVDSAGNNVAGESGAITLPPSATSEQMSVGLDGTVSAGGQPLGKLRIVEFDDPSTLEGVSGTIFRAPDDVTPKSAEKSTVRQGYREMSNVNVIQEMVDLITVSRMYEANARAMKKTGESKEQLIKVAMS